MVILNVSSDFTYETRMPAIELVIILFSTLKVLAKAMSKVKEIKGIRIGNK